jgi:hypothetical protein
MVKAISQNILLAVANTSHDDDIIRMKNIQTKYKGSKSSISNIKIELPVEGNYPEWQNYLLCGIKGVVDYLKKLGETQKKGFLICVGLTISFCFW